MPCRLTLLGSVCLTGPDGPSLRRASQQRRIALLAMLASSPVGSVSRDRLLGILWPERDERTARHLLADSLYVLRQTLGDDAIVATGEALRLSPEVVWSDVAEFRRAVADERWREALALYQGDFLDGFLVRNACEFDQWAVAERARLRDLALRAALSLANSLEKSGRIAEAAAAAERALELAPCDESVFRHVVRLLIAAENRARAEALACSFLERLATEIGVSPSAETMRLVADVRSSRSSEPVIVVALGTPRNGRARGIDSVTASIIAQGRYHWHQRTRVALQRAIDYFTRATERAARSAEAWSGLADAWTIMGGRGYLPVAEVADRAEASARRALMFDDTLSAAHTSMGGVHFLRRQWGAAESSLRNAIQIDPQNADAHHWLALMLTSGFGARDEALREQTIAARLNPVSPMQLGALGWYRYLRGEYERARSDLEPAVDLNADLEEGRVWLARVAARLGDEETVTATITAGLNRRREPRGNLIAEHASAFAVLGDSRRARRLAAKATARGAMPLNLALAWASIGEADRAFDCLGRESFSVYWTPQALWWDPRFDAMRDDARFAGVRERVARIWTPEWT
ncbi:MAG TPA: BTAD domain-containing putative transcriptional regulator [Gemmatimonadaceae bacterium]|nr:BTAD domain-containing putative transcriptional regulator [Gemmatimonadaceae bacterium]